MALLSAQKSRLQQWKDEGRRGAAEAILMRETPERFLITIQIVMTFMDVFAAVLAGAVAILKITPWIVEGWALPAVTFWTHALALGLMVGVLTCVGLLVGQLVRQSHCAAACRTGALLDGPSAHPPDEDRRCSAGGVDDCSHHHFVALGQRRPRNRLLSLPSRKRPSPLWYARGQSVASLRRWSTSSLRACLSLRIPRCGKLCVPRVRIQALEVTTPPQEVIRKVGEMGHSPGTGIQW